MFSLVGDRKGRKGKCCDKGTRRREVSSAHDRELVGLVNVVGSRSIADAIAVSQTRSRYRGYVRGEVVAIWSGRKHDRQWAAIGDKKEGIIQ